MRMFNEFKPGRFPPPTTGDKHWPGQARPGQARLGKEEHDKGAERKLSPYNLTNI